MYNIFHINVGESMFFNKSLEDRVENAKQDKDELNKLIEEYKPFVASTVQKKVGKYMRYGYDDELSIGLMAFHEAIKAYDKKKGKFLSFAKQVIQLRLIDYQRKKNKDKSVVYLSGEDQEKEKYYLDLGNQKAIQQHKVVEENELRKIEIEEYKSELEQWGINFADLVKHSPKQQKLRKTYKDIAVLIVREKDLLSSLTTSKRLPIAEIQKSIDIHRKKIERGRIYIIALVVALSGDFEFIQGYLIGR